MNSENPEQPANNKVIWTPFRIVAVYIILGFLWIIFSDSLLAYFIKDASVLTQFQTYKGWLYVLATALLLYWLINRYTSEIRHSDATLKESEARFRAIASNTPDHILMQDSELKYLLVINPQLGMTEKDMIGKTDYDFLPKEDADKLASVKRRVLETGKPFKFETSLISKDGQTEFFDGTYVPRFNAHGQVDGLIGYFRNVTEQKRAEEERQKFFLLAESSNEFIGMCDLDLQPLYVNPAGVSMVGLPDMAAACRVKVQDYFFPEDQRFIVEEFFPRVMREGHGDVEIRLRHFQTGKPIWMFYYLFSVREASGKAVGWATVSHDITERKRAEEELRLTNEELLSINRIIATTTTTASGVKQILDGVLDEALHITGLEGGTICLISDDTLDLAVHRATSDATIQDLSTNQVKIGDCLCGECARDHKPLILWDREAVLRFSTREAQRGEDIRFHAAFPLITGDKCLGVLCVFTRTDRKPFERRLKLLETITSQIALAVSNAQLYEKTVRHAATLEDKVRERTADLQESQRALINLVEDLNSKTEELQNANIKLKDLDRLKSMFIASMSHELRTPLNSVIGFSSILLNEWVGPLNAEQKENLASVLKAGKHLLALINDVIDLSKVEAGTIDVHAEEFDIYDLMAEALNVFKKDIDAKGLDLRVDSMHQKMLTDRRRLLQCVINLVSNAVKFTERGSVHVQARRVKCQGSSARGQETKVKRQGEEDSSLLHATWDLPLDADFIEISVVDSGIGIKKEDISKLFQAFTRLESPLKSKVLGTGLGLYLSRKLVTEVLKGEIIVKSEYGKGSRFTLRIPINIGSGSK